MAVMLRAKALVRTLQQVTDDDSGILCSLLVQKDGDLLAFSGTTGKEARVSGAIVSNIWQAYEAQEAAVDSDKLKHVMVSCKEGRLVVVPVARLLLCLIGKDSVGFGILKLKALALAAHLNEPLSKVNFDFDQP